jgi:signal transduction histidine kinase/CheY-like chemotaxis protein
MIKWARKSLTAQADGRRQILVSLSKCVILSTGWLRTQRVSGPLFRKYVVLFIGVVCVALLSSGSLEIWFSFQDHKTSLIRIQREQAEAAAAKISQFIKEVEGQIGWTTHLPWSEGTLIERQFDGRRLLRQVPAVSEVMQLDSSGREQLRLSRFTIDEIASYTDYSKDPKFTEAMAHGIYYSPVYFRYESEPYMSISMAGTRREDGVTVTDVNLKLIWDIVSQIKVGERGKAYVVDAEGRLISHPDISLVLRNTNLSRLGYVQEALISVFGSLPPRAEIAEDVLSRKVLTAYAPIAPLKWLVFVELPIEEAYAPLYASILRYGTLVLAGLVLAGLAGLLLARRMMVPIQALGDGAARIGGGDLSQRIVITTGDELEALGDEFNSMAAKLQNSYATLERKVEERTHQLELANRTKSRFLAVASHDLRQPLHALGLFVAHLRNNLESTERERIVELIGSAVAEMNELFNALLDISKLEAGVLVPNLTEFPIERLLRRIESTFARAAGEKGLRLRVIPSAAWVRSDVILLERILLNLVSNAVRYSSSGGIVVGCRRRGETLRIEVWDSGPGIPDDERQNVFAEFYQLADGEHHLQGGLGLGLAIVDQLRRLLDHPVELTSIVGKGSRFTIVVPAAATGKVAEPIGSPQLTLDPARGKCIAVIDDDVLVLEATSALLRSWGCQVVASGSHDAALAHVTSDGNRPDLIISDYRLADRKTGIEVIEHLRTAFSAQIPAFLISGDIAPEPLRHARTHGYYLLHKPLAPMTLRAMLNRHLKNYIKTDDGAKPTMSMML